MIDKSYSLGEAYDRILQQWKFKVSLTIMKILNMISIFACHAKKRKSVLAFSKFIYKYGIASILQVCKHFLCVSF